MRERWVPFAYGFRPFFLLSGIYAGVSIAAWLWMYNTGASPLRPLPPQLWHGHEMLFGFVAATIAGFMLTAVPSWTGSKGFAGAPLVVLVLLWLAGRVTFFFSDALPFGLVAFCNLLFIPGLISTLARSLLRGSNRNTPFLLVLAAFWTCDAVFLYQLSQTDVLQASATLRVALDIVLLLITIIGGRIVPAFTANALRQRGIDFSVRSLWYVERLVIVAMIALIVVDILAPGHWLAALVAAIAGLLHIWRIAGWNGLKTYRDPIVWILHVAYLWLPAGLLLKALFVGGEIAWAAHWQHALGAGAAATMIVAVMTRASLGHTGRALSVVPAIAASYVVLTVAVIVRVFGPTLLPVDYRTTVLTAGALWVLAFLLYVLVYAPILLRPRVDGKSG